METIVGTYSVEIGQSVARQTSTVACGPRASTRLSSCPLMASGSVARGKSSSSLASVSLLSAARVPSSANTSAAGATPSSTQLRNRAKRTADRMNDHSPAKYRNAHFQYRYAGNRRRIRFLAAGFHMARALLLRNGGGKLNASVTQVFRVE